MKGFAFALCAGLVGLVALNYSKGNLPAVETLAAKGSAITHAVTASDSATSFEPWVQQRLDFLAGETLEPDAAEFRNVRVTDSGAICGEMNHKNPFGGFMGFERFVIVSETEGRFRYGILREGAASQAGLPMHDPSVMWLLNCAQ